ncbi:TPA_asm: maturation protein, partial [ssRNA phage Esthiorhiza.4_11]
PSQKRGWLTRVAAFRCPEFRKTVVLGVPRDRLRTAGVHTGHSTHLPTGQTFVVSVSPLWYDRCQDTAYNRDYPNPLSIEHRHYLKVGTVSGKAPAFPVYSMSGYPFDNQGFSASHPAVPTLPTPVEAITRVQASTNPSYNSNIDVSLPNFLFELKDIPSMLRQKGTNHRSTQSSNSTAEYNFGWAQLFRDLQTMLHFTTTVDEHIATQEFIAKNGGLKRKRGVYSSSTLVSGAPTTFQSFNVGVLGFVNKVQRVDMWASIQWAPNDTGIKSGEEMRSLALRQAHGWDFSSGAIASVIWEAMPWSWFADYFGNVGTYFKSQRNLLNMTAHNGCVMTRVTTTQSQVITSVSPGFVASPGSYKYETKSRVLANAGLSFASIPLFGAGQLVTLSSIIQSLGK